MDNKVALSLLVKMGGTHDKEILGLSKQICDYLQSKKILITAEYLPVHLNVTVDWESFFRTRATGNLTRKNL